MNWLNAIRTGSIILLSVWLAACGGSGGGGDDDDGLRLKDLNGTWTTPCLLDGAVTVRGTLNIDDGVVISQIVFYSDVTCMTIMMDEIETFDIKLGDEVTLDGSVAGIVTATEIDITNTTVGSPNNGDEEYDLIAIKDNKLYLGDSDGANDGSTPALRPTQLDAVVVFEKM